MLIIFMYTLYDGYLLTGIKLCVLEGFLLEPRRLFQQGQHYGTGE